jgi:hypothetical protein
VLADAATAHKMAASGIRLDVIVRWPTPDVMARGHHTDCPQTLISGCEGRPSGGDGAKTMLRHRGVSRTPTTKSRIEGRKAKRRSMLSQVNLRTKLRGRWS